MFLSQAGRTTISTFSRPQKLSWRLIRRDITSNNEDSVLQNMNKLTSALINENVPATVNRVCLEFQTNYKLLNKQQETKFLTQLAPKTKTDKDAVTATVEKYVKIVESGGKVDKLEDEMRSVLEPPIHKVFSRIGQTKGGVKFLVDLRKNCLAAMKGLDQKSTEYKNMQELSKNLKSLLSLWISVGFMSLQRVTWDSPSSMLQKISEYEAVHPLRNWTDLKNRVGAYRRVFVYTHPSMEAEPLVVLHVALTKEISSGMKQVLKDFRSVKNVVHNHFESHDDIEADNTEHINTDEEEHLESVDTAIFYSITSTQQGLQGIELGTHLIKQAVASLKKEIPSLRRFSTLSPIPGFRSWLLMELKRNINDGSSSPLEQHEVQKLQELVWGGYVSDDVEKSSVEKYLYDMIKTNRWTADPDLMEDLQPVLMRLCARYLYQEKRRNKALDPVANFHIRNGAVLYRINWMADPSPRGMDNSCGIMVNYRYFLEDVENNSCEYINNNILPVNKQVLQLL